jgi:hypothetical protein
MAQLCLIDASNAEFVRMLSAMRIGRIDDEIVKKFHDLCRPVEYPDGIEPSCLYVPPNTSKTTLRESIKVSA